LKNAYLDREYTLPYAFKISNILQRLTYNETVKSKDGKDFSDYQLGLIYEVEIMSYVSFYETLLEIDENLKPTSTYSLKIKNSILSFKDKCELAVVNFEEILTSTRVNKLAVRIKPKELINQRPLLRLIMISVLNLFLKPFEK
jgi:hypothetical protein